MTEEDDSTPRKLELSPVQVAASALAATSAAFVASWAGTAGTLIGAALGSVIATVGAATYTYSLKRTSELARRTAAQVREGALLPNGLPRTRGRVDETAVMPPVEDGATPAEAGEDVAWWRRFDPRGKQLPWGRVALASAAVMLVTLAVLTSFEGVTGRSVSDTVTGDDSSRTTVGNVFRGGGDTRDEEPAPQEDEQQPDDGATPSPSDDATPSDDADPTPTTEPTEEPSVEPTPTVEPTTPTPTPSAPAPDAAEPTEAPDASPSATPSA
ncbi:hypothetical protein [Nocardioides aequoreus]|uniref:hypothetical protein n=1 Tax=Nocardioides aequoreus TaxID=397278 RepID=UPI00056AA413|nr:hypothetical protein [Nocardioides aequoreus]